MKYLLLLSLIAGAALANAATLTGNCGGALPVQVCAHLTSLQGTVTNLARRSITVMAKAVQQSAERHARLFAEIMVLINTASAKRQIDPTKLAVIMQDLQILLKKAEMARGEAIQTAMKAIQEASMKIIALIQKIIADAVNGSSTDLGTLERQLKQSLASSHEGIRNATFEAIRKVQQGNRRVEVYVVRIFGRLGCLRAPMGPPFVDAMSTEENMKIADNGEHEIEADFDAAAKKAYELVTLKDKGITKRTLYHQWWWGRVVAWQQQLQLLMPAEIQRQLVAIRLQMHHSLHVILHHIINVARQVIINITKNTVIIHGTPTPVTPFPSQ